MIRELLRTKKDRGRGGGGGRGKNSFDIIDLRKQFMVTQRKINK